jgi:hypothetical protein
MELPTSNIKYQIIKICFVIGLFLLLATNYALRTTHYVYAGPQSTTYELKEYGFGAGGESSISATTYSLFGTIGETDMASSSSTTYIGGGGLIFTLQAAVPPGPTVNNPGSNYDRLQIIVNTGGNPSDALFAISLSDGTNTYYVQNDRTIGTILGLEDWLPYTGGIASGWGDASGFYVTGLKNNTTYTVFVKAKQGIYTETGWGPGVAATTSDPSFTFGTDASTVTFSNLNSGNSYTDSTKTTILTTSTNAYNGYIIYGYETQPLTHTIDGSKTIANYTGSNSSPTSWTGTGFGYTTNDNDLTGGTADRFTNSGPNYAGFGTSTPGDPVADHTGPILSPISNETFTVSYRVTASSSTTAGQYRTTVIYVAVPTY